MLTTLEYRLLATLYPRSSGRRGESAYDNRSKLATLMGEDFYARIAGKAVIDFGCGTGAAAVEMASRGASRVGGVDIQESVLEVARRRAAEAGVADRCWFGAEASERADVLVSIDAFEHFADPAGVLRQMASLLNPGGEVLVSFGPTWYHPRGGHLFSVFPWAHILLREEALIRWRSTFKTDGATRFGEVAGGLNQMTIARFRRLVAKSPLTLTSLETVPIRPLRLLHNRATREFTTSVVRCRMVSRA